MITSTKPRGTCPECWREFRLLKDGSVGRHGKPGVFPPEDCDGVRKKPADITEET